MNAYDDSLSAGCLRSGRAPAKAANAAAALAREAPFAGRTFAHGAPLRRSGALLRIRRGALLSRGRCARCGRGRTALRLHASRRHCSPSEAEKNAALTEHRHRRHLRSAVHRPLPRALPVQPIRARALQDRCVCRLLVRRFPHRSRRQSSLRSDRLVRRERVRLRLLQGMHRPRQRARARSWAGSRRLSPGHRLQRAPSAADLGHG